MSGIKKTPESHDGLPSPSEDYDAFKHLSDVGAVLGYGRTRFYQWCRGRGFLTPMNVPSHEMISPDIWWRCYQRPAIPGFTSRRMVSVTSVVRLRQISNVAWSSFKFAIIAFISRALMQNLLIPEGWWGRGKLSDFSPLRHECYWRQLFSCYDKHYFLQEPRMKHYAALLFASALLTGCATQAIPPQQAQLPPRAV